MEKKYDASEIISLVDRSFTNFGKEMSEGAQRLGRQVPKDPQFNVMLSMIKIAIMGEIMNILREEK